MAAPARATCPAPSRSTRSRLLADAIETPLGEVYTRPDFQQEVVAYYAEHR